MTFRSGSLKALFACCVACSTQLAHAEPSTAEISTARQAFETAVRLEADQKWVEAALRLRQALAIKDTPGLRFHLAHCEAEQGLLVEASLDYDRASELIRQGVKAPDVQKLLTVASAELKKRIPHVTVEIPSDAPSPVAELDGKAYAPSELALGQALNPGPHRLEISATGREPFADAFVLKEGAQISIRAELPRAEPPRPAAGAVPAPSTPPSQVGSAKPIQPRGRPSPKPYLLLGESAITVAGLALGIGYAVAASSARDRVQSAQGRIDEAASGNAGACSTPGSSLGGTCAELRAAIDDHDRDATVSTVGFACAGVGAAALLTTWLVYPNAAAESAGPSVQPVIALGRIGVQGRF